MINFFKPLSSTYKTLILMLLFIIGIQLSTLIYIWKVESDILLKKERTLLQYQSEQNAKHIILHLNRLKKELQFLSTLEIMDDMLTKDIDKRISRLLEKQAKDFAEGIILLAKKDKKIIASSQTQSFQGKDYFSFQVPIFTAYNQSSIGHLYLLYPWKNLSQLQNNNPYQRLWLKPTTQQKGFDYPSIKESIIVAVRLPQPLKDWILFLSYEKEHAFKSMYEIEKILIISFFFSLLFLLLIVWILSKKQIELLEHTQEVLQLKRTFLSTISHELRTPLGSILTLTQHLIINPKLSNDDIDTLGKIENASEHLLSMINNLLQLSKLESNMMPVEKRSINIIETIEEIIEIVEPLIEEKNIKLIKNIPNKNILIETDINLFKQIFINLLSNAIKFTEEGSITIELKEDYITQTYTLTIIDTGIGIEEGKQHSLFSEYYQAHKGRKEIKHSTGLGLALSQKVAQLINGHILLESKGLNQGTKAKFVFKSLK